jgi:cytochrome c biogenesis protein CcmG/thiol:disulfide interchange protein DsbE
VTKRSTRARLLVLAVALVAVVVAGVFLLRPGGGVQGHGSGGGAATSTDPARFDLPSLSGSGHIRLADFRGKPLVVNFFASWCTACRGEGPGFVRVESHLHGAVAFVGVNSLESGDGRAFAREIGYDRWPLARDVDGGQDGGLHDALGGQGLPITAFYDGNGKLLKVVLGAMSEDVLRSRIQDLFHSTP